MISSRKLDETVSNMETNEATVTDRPTLITWEIETITPEIAEGMLAHITAPVRRDKVAVAKYVEAMQAGGWVYNGLPIIIDENGGLLDGYQRLTACVEAGVPFKTLVARNVKADTLHTMDQHRRRTYASVLQSRGYRLGTDIQSALTKLIRIETGDFKKSIDAIGWLRLDLVLAANPEIVDACEFSDSIDDKVTHRKARSPFSFMAIKSGHGEQLHQFMSDMQNKDLGPENPARMLSINLESMIASRKLTQIDADIMLGMMILAFNDYLAGKKAHSVYSWAPDYGKAALTPAGRPASLLTVRETAPWNCGLPLMSGYPGLKEGATLVEEGKGFTGVTADELIDAASKDIHDAGVHLRLVTPEMAEKWLEKFNTVNRKIQDSHVAAIVRDIKRGSWMVNAQPISFHGNPLADGDDDVHLINGQHRLKACVKSGVAIEIPIAVNVPRAAFATFDSHMKRNKFVSKGDPRVLRSALIFQWRNERGLDIFSTVRPTETEILEVYNNHPNLKDFYTEARKMDGGETLEKIASAGVITYFLYHIYLDDTELAQPFTDQLRTGVGLEKGNPIGGVRSDLMQHKKSVNKYSRKQVLEMLLETWSDYKAWFRKANKRQSKLL